MLPLLRRARPGTDCQKAHCRGEHCSPVPVRLERSFPKRALLRQVGGRTMFAPTFSIRQSRCFFDILRRARPGCVDFVPSIAQNVAVYHTFAPEFAVCSQRERPCGGAGALSAGKCKIAQKLPACKIGLYTRKSARGAPRRPYRQRQHR